jgi:hypothetical protein
VNASVPPYFAGDPARLSPEAAQLYAVLENLALRIVTEHPQPDVVAFDLVLNAALTAHAVHHYLRCGIDAALDAYDLPAEALPIARHLVGLTMPQAEAVRLIARATVWRANFESRAAAAPANDPGR